MHEYVVLHSDQDGDGYALYRRYPSSKYICEIKQINDAKEIIAKKECVDVSKVIKCGSGGMIGAVASFRVTLNAEQVW